MPALMIVVIGTNFSISNPIISSELINNKTRVDHVGLEPSMVYNRIGLTNRTDETKIKNIFLRVSFGVLQECTGREKIF